MTRPAPSAPRTALRRLGLAAAAAATLAGCGRMPDSVYSVTPFVGAPVTDNETPYSRCLTALRKVPGNRVPTLAIGDIRDKTGQFLQDSYTESTVVTQGVSEMFISAFYKTGKARLAERLDMGVALTEQRLAEMGLLPNRAAAIAPTPADFIVLGAMTELNYNILSSGLRLYFGGFGGGYRQMVINVGMDLRLVDVRTLRTLYVTSLQKQIVGFEVEAGVFRFFGAKLLEFDAGGIRNEPLQVGVRSVVEMAVLQILTEGFGLPTPENCDLDRIEFGSGDTAEATASETTTTTTTATPEGDDP